MHHFLPVLLVLLVLGTEQLGKLFDAAQSDQVRENAQRHTMLGTRSLGHLARVVFHTSLNPS